MFFFSKSKNTELPPLSPATTPESTLVLETLHSIDLDPEEVMLVGSAALALYGIRLEADPFHEFDPIPLTRPTDVDFTATPAYMEHVYDHGILPGTSLPVAVKDQVNKERKILEVKTSPLAIDLITSIPRSDFFDDKDIRRHSDKVRQRIRTHGRLIKDTATPLRVIRPESLEKELRFNSLLDPKAERDLLNLRAVIHQNDR